jgi:hypothetical protein
VTVSGIQLLSTTWKSTDGTVSHGKYIIGNAIVYRDVYRGCSVNRTDRAVNFRFARENEAARAADATACIDTSVGTLLKNGWRRG